MPPYPLAQLNAATPAEFVAALGDIFEHAPWVAEAAASRRPFATVTALHEAMLAILAATPEPQLLRFLNNHPDLASPRERSQSLTADSQREQTGAGLDLLTPEETAMLADGNASYRARFGFPFIICALRHSQDAIFAALERRLHGDPASEHRTALAEIARISALRLARKVEGDGMPPVFGALSTHLLDTATGTPAAGIPIELHLVSKTGTRLITAAISNADGRTDQRLIHGRPIPIGTYELRFTIGGYFAERNIASLYDVVPLRFTVAEAEAHYHIPLLFSPWSYTTYRGS